MDITSSIAAPLLDRAREQRRLSRALAATRAGAGSVVLLEGAAGIGKTSLLRDAVASVRRDGWQVLSARGTPLEQDFAFGVLRQLIDSSRRAPPQLLQPLGNAAEAESKSTEFELLHQLYWWLVDRADDAPVLLAVDDVHWADLPSLRMLNFLAVRVDQLRLTVLAGTRAPEDTIRTGLIHDLMNHWSTTVIRPSPLSTSAVRTLLSVELG